MNQMIEDLTVAANSGDLATVTKLVQAGADVNGVDVDDWTALRAAAREGFPAVVEYLLAAGADVQATHEEGWNALHMVVDGTPGGRPVNFTITVVREGRTVELTDRGEIREATGSHPDYEYDRRMAVVRTLIDAEIDVNQVDNRRQTPLMRAANLRDDRVSTEILEAIVASGRATIDAVDEAGFAALHYASQWGNLGAVRVLLSAGADPNLAEDYGFTPLHEAARNGQVRVVRALLDAGADPDARTTRAYGHHAVNSTPRDLAEHNRCQGVVDALDDTAR